VATVSWRQGDGRHRHVGEPPAGAELLAPTLEDGYLTLLDSKGATVAT
jgi:ABC-2 type transport system ATP-binding protein